MKPRRILDLVVTADGRELVLDERGGVFTIRVDGDELMCSRSHGSEQALAHLALNALDAPDGRSPLRVLVGGLGMGFTLRASLDALDPRRAATVVVVEVFPAVVDWNRGPLAHLARRPLDDRRVRLVVGDVVDCLVSEPPFDAILLDVDNGPESFTLDSNRRLYGRAGLDRLHRALTSGGALAIWSAGDDRRFCTRLAAASFQPTSHRVAARPSGKGGRHVVFLARRT